MRPGWRRGAPPPDRREAPPKSAPPRIAPISTELTATSVVTLVKLNSSLMKRIAPEMTPVSNPKRIPATAAIAATTRTNPPVTRPGSEVMGGPPPRRGGSLPNPGWRG
ncbi:hypothetical protein, partial [Methanoculleus chikugoensis]|uniref:hypothetical protein n=1 Tax=Methanoculleus chikugoensis TaxID=118126 RepID=UPI001FB3C61F